MSNLVDYLTFCSYAENRRLSPDVTPEQWKLVFGAEVDKLEERYQREQAVERAREQHYDLRSNT